MKKFFSNPNRLLNFLCAISSVLVFCLCVFSVVSNLFGTTYEASTSQIEFSRVELTNDSYNTTGGNSNKTKLSFTKETDGTYGEAAILEVFKHFDDEINRAYTETGIAVETNGLVSANSSGVNVVQAMSIKSSRDITGDIYYTEGNKEVTSTSFGPSEGIRAFVSGGKARYESASGVSASGSKVNLSFSGSNIQEKEYNKFLTENGLFVDLSPITLTTNTKIVDLASCKLTENVLGYTLSYNVLTNGNDFISKYANKFAYGADAVSGTTAISKYSMVISFNKYGQFTSCETYFALKLKKNVPVLGGVWADTTANLKSTFSYKNENYRVEKF